MPMKPASPLLLICALLLSGATAAAGELGGELTPLGAIRAGNDDGTIPPWEGGITSPPERYKPGMHHLDPFEGDEILFTITADTVAEHAARLSPGQIAMLERYPDTWRMHVYPSRRSASFPQRVYQQVMANATTAALSADGNAVTGAGVASPFPIPQSGLEAVWNHLLRYRGERVRRETVQAVPTAGGAYIEVRIDERALYPYAQPDAVVDDLNNVFAYFLQEVVAPAQIAGTILLIHETLDQRAEPRHVWAYNTGQRRVRRATGIAYDAPGTASDGQRTADQVDMFNGAPDRYEWELIGRRELYVPYNSYLLHSDGVRHADILKPGHIDPDLARYELHRVWQVEARLKDGASHVYARRTFFLDEDSWQILIADHYDGAGDLWRVAEAHTINYYEVPMLWDTLISIYDLKNGRYLALGLNNELPVDDLDPPLSKSDFTPDALRRLGRR
jgi:hypothetical protein